MHKVIHRMSNFFKGKGCSSKKTKPVGRLKQQQRQRQQQQQEQRQNQTEAQVQEQTQAQQREQQKKEKEMKQTEGQQRHEPQHKQRQRKTKATTTTTRTVRAVQQYPIAEFIPFYLRRYIHPHRGDFCYTHLFDYRLIAQLMSEGFLPIATEGILLPKLHEHRCVITLPDNLHVSKSVRKKSKKFTITINQAFDDVIDGCKKQHGENCWLYPNLVDAFQEIRNHVQIDARLIIEGNNDNDISSEKRVCPVRLYSIEIWNATTNELAGGELGYTVGSVYTSLTGFSKEDSAGSVQLAALGRLLCTLGFTLWDLGMEMDYKTSLGSQLMPRRSFVQHVHSVREVHGHFVLQIPSSYYASTFSSSENTATTTTANGDNHIDSNPPPPYRSINAKLLIDQQPPVNSSSQPSNQSNKESTNPISSSNKKQNKNKNKTKNNDIAKSNAQQNYNGNTVHELSNHEHNSNGDDHNSSFQHHDKKTRLHSSPISEEDTAVAVAS